MDVEKVCSKPCGSRRYKILPFAGYERGIPGRHTAWWLYLVAVVFALTFFFNARQEVWGPRECRLDICLANDESRCGNSRRTYG